MSTKSEDKAEVISEINDILDTLTPNEAEDIFSRVSIIKLLKLQQALRSAISRTATEAADE